MAQSRLVWRAAQQRTGCRLPRACLQAAQRDRSRVGQRRQLPADRGRPGAAEVAQAGGGRQPGLDRRRAPAHRPPARSGTSRAAPPCSPGRRRCSRSSTLAPPRLLVRPSMLSQRTCTPPRHVCGGLRLRACSPAAHVRYAYHPTARSRPVSPPAAARPAERMCAQARQSRMPWRRAWPASPRLCGATCTARHARCRQRLPRSCRQSPSWWRRPWTPGARAAREACSRPPGFATSPPSRR